jgi:2-dehydro-3-deoxyphosphogluconate aldolase/(4S)-4-hydroxy-2-oxoglutarate aldolase
MQIDHILDQAGVIPVIVIDHLEDAVPLAQALVDGGLTVLEVTLRSPVAMAAISEIAQSVSGAIVGVGTVTRVDQFDTAAQAGASFAVSPGLTRELAAASNAAAMPFLPGVFTPGEVLHALEMGFSRLKLFPAKQAGGLGMLKAMSGPIPEAIFCPTGGVGSVDYLDYLALANVACVGGSWVCPNDAIQQKDWQRITRLAREVTDTIKRVG